MIYIFNINRRAEIALESIPLHEREKIITFLHVLESDPFLGQVRSKVFKLKLPGNYYVARASNNFRVIFQVNDNVIEVIDIVRHDRLERFFKNMFRGKSE